MSETNSHETSTNWINTITKRALEKYARKNAEIVFCSAQPNEFSFDLTLSGHKSQIHKLWTFTLNVRNEMKQKINGSSPISFISENETNSVV